LHLRRGRSARPRDVGCWWKDPTWQVSTTGTQTGGRRPRAEGSLDIPWTCVRSRSLFSDEVDKRLASRSSRVRDPEHAERRVPIAGRRVTRASSQAALPEYLSASGPDRAKAACRSAQLPLPLSVYECVITRAYSASCIRYVYASLLCRYV